MNISRAGAVRGRHQTIRHVSRKPVHKGSNSPSPLKDVEHVAKDVVGGLANTGKDIIHGNIIGAVKDIGKGIYNTGKDIIKGIGHFFKSIF